jgi:hypothetical protein
VAQNVIFASLAIALAMMAACIADIITGFPFAGQTTMDIMFIIASAVVGWMAIDCLRGMRKR